VVGRGLATVFAGAGAGSAVRADPHAQLTFDELRSAIEDAERTNSKLLVIADATVSRPVSVLVASLPWARRLGPNLHPPTTAIDRVDHHLARTNEAGQIGQQAAELLRQRRQTVERYRVLTVDHDRSRDPNDRGRDIGYGID